MVGQVEKEIQYKEAVDPWRVWWCARGDGRILEGKIVGDCARIWERGCVEYEGNRHIMTDYGIGQKSKVSKGGEKTSSASQLHFFCICIKPQRKTSGHMKILGACRDLIKLACQLLITAKWKHWMTVEILEDILRKLKQLPGSSNRNTGCHPEKESVRKILQHQTISHQIWPIFCSGWNNSKFQGPLLPIFF